MDKNNQYITTPIYYVNDQPHLGHAYTTVVGDVLARHYRRTLGKDFVYFLTGTDEHGSKVAEKAASLGKDPQSFTDEIAQLFQTAWQELSVTNDQFIRTTSDKHTKAVRKILLALHDVKTPSGNPAIYEGVYKGLYCVGCEKFLTSRDIVDGVCPIHKSIPQELEEKNWFFRLTDYLPLVRKAIEDGTMQIHPDERKNETLGLFNQGIDDFSISRSTVKWGIPIPWDETQRAYVWVDALSNYITAIGYPDDTSLYERWWTQSTVTHLMAADILKFHAIYWPALLLALGVPLPEHLYVHGYFTIDGQKMSKTLGNVVRPGDLVRRYGVDATRYLILSQFSFGFEGDIKVAEFDAKYNADLANSLGNLLSRVTTMVEKYLNGAVAVDTAPDPVFQQLVSSFIERLAFRDATLAIWSKVGECNRRIDSEKPWKLATTDRDALQTLLVGLMTDLYNIGYALEPFMPSIAKTITDTVARRPLVKADPLFARMMV